MQYGFGTAVISSTKHQAMKILTELKTLIQILQVMFWKNVMR